MSFSASFSPVISFLSAASFFSASSQLLDCLKISTAFSAMSRLGSGSPVRASAASTRWPKRILSGSDCAFKVPFSSYILTSVFQPCFLQISATATCPEYVTLFRCLPSGPARVTAPPSCCIRYCPPGSGSGFKRHTSA